MSSFDEKLLRLKKSLDLYKDKEISELLGLTQKSLSARKSRGAFPEEKLLALVMEQPNLHIDLEYVLTGKPSGGMTRAEAKRLGILKPDSYVAQAIASVGDDDGSRDGEPFTMNTPTTYHLSKDEWELMKRFRSADLTTKMQVMQLLLSVDMTDKTTDDYTPKSNENKGSGINVSGNGNRVAGKNYSEGKK